MKQQILLFSIFLSIALVSQDCIPRADSFIESNNLRTGLNSYGNFCTMLEYPKRTQQQIKDSVKPRGIVFDAGLWLIAKNQNNYFLSNQSYSGNNNSFDFSPGPISLRDGATSAEACKEFDRVWKIDKLTIDNHIALLKQGVTFPMTNLPQTILDWPSKGNKLYAIVPIYDDLAPFIDYNNNGIYDPENGDYPKIKGDVCSFSVFNDIGNNRNTEGLGIEIHMLSYTYRNHTSSNFDNSIFYDYKVNRKKAGDIDSFIFSLFYDVDLGNYKDDYAGCYSSQNIAYVSNSDTIYDSTLVGVYGKYTPVFISRLLDRKMGAHFTFNNNPNGMPTTNTTNLFRRLCGQDSIRYQNDGNPIYYSAPYNTDVRSVQSFQPIKLNYNKPEAFSFMIYVYQPKFSINNIVDSIIDIFDTIDKKRTESSIKFVQQRENIFIYPNPASDYLEIILPTNVIPEEAGIYIYDVVGRKIPCQAQNDGNGKLNIDVKDLPEGIYLLKISDKKGEILKQEKVVIQNE